MLADGRPVGVVTVFGSLIENLYVLPEMQNRGYGSRLLDFAISQCEGTPTLWILCNNDGARRLYARRGFQETGEQHPLARGFYELKMRLR